MQEPVRVPGVRIDAEDLTDRPPGGAHAARRARIDTPRYPIRENNMKLTKKEVNLMILEELGNVLLEGDIAREKRLQWQDDPEDRDDVAGEWPAPNVPGPDPTQTANPAQLVNKAQSLVDAIYKSTQQSNQMRNMNFSPARDIQKAITELKSALSELSEFIGGDDDGEQEDTFSADKERFIAP
jgi:hypothetical protein